MIRSYCQTLPCSICTCVGAFHRTEKFGFKKVGRNRGNIDGHECAATIGEAMEGSSSDFFTDSGLPHKKDRQMGRNPSRTTRVALNGAAAELPKNPVSSTPGSVGRVPAGAKSSNTPV